MSFDINFHLYGFFIALGVLVGSWIAERFRKKQSTINNQQLVIPVYDLLPWVLIPAIIGARLYHVFDYWQYYTQNLKEVLMVWQGGLGIFGALLGGFIGLYSYSFLTCWQRPKGKNFKELFNCSIVQLFNLADLAAIGLPVGQAIGRLGNYFNQELYGLPTSLPWGIYINPENRLPGYESFSKFHPLFAYEGLWCLIIFIILFKTLNTKKPGRLFFIYLGLYSFGRFWLEFLRMESWLVRRLRVNQLVALGLMIISGWFLGKLHI